MRNPRVIPLTLALVLMLGTVPTYAADSSGTSENNVKEPGCCETVSINTAASVVAVAGFRDVRSTDYYADAVKWCKERGVTNGTSADTFSPDSTVTRGQAVTFLWRAAGSPEPASKVSPFTDVKDSGAYYYKAVLWAEEQGITNGVNSTTFGLNGTLSYDQMLTFLCRASGKTADGSDWSYTAVNWAEQNGLTDGLSFSVKDGCPRSDVVFFLWNQLSGKTTEEKQTAETPAGLSVEEGAEAAIVNGFLERTTQIDVSDYNIESSRLQELALEIADFHGENPYNIVTLVCKQTVGQQALFLQVVYQDQGNISVKGANAEIQALAKDVVEEVVTSDMSEYETAKVLHDWLILNCEYDMRYYEGGMPYESYTAYGPLKNRIAVCAGYAEAYKALLEAAGMEAEYVSGYAGGGRHGWNIIKVDGAWYHVDTTWDDPIPDKEGYIRYNYFLKSDSYMRSNRHSDWSASHVCTSTKYDGATLPDTDEQAKQKAIACL